jgi:hypothetical protein
MELYLGLEPFPGRRSPDRRATNGPQKHEIGAREQARCFAAVIGSPLFEEVMKTILSVVLWWRIKHIRYSPCGPLNYIQPSSFSSGLDYLLSDI